MKKFLVCFCLIVSVASASDLHAQSVKVNAKFGKVSDEEVRMTEYDKDTSAVAVILYDNEFKVINFDASALCVWSRRNMSV